MGTWGPGLYANDLAKDLKSTISSVARLPLSATELVELLRESFPEASNDQDDEDYPAFWLAVADQFHKLGIDEPTTFKRAREIVDLGPDAGHPERDAWTGADRRKREKTLAELRTRLDTPPVAKSRTTLKKPEPLVMQSGDLIVFPKYLHDNCVNPYFATWTFPQEGWRAACILRADHVFGYLACYWPLVLASSLDMASKPDKESLLRAENWRIQRPGVCSKLHCQRMKIEKLGTVDLAGPQLEKALALRDGRYQAVNQISISNSLTGTMMTDATAQTLSEFLRS